MADEKPIHEIKHTFSLHTNGRELYAMLDELEALIKKINDFTLVVYAHDLPAQESNQ